MLVFEKSRPGRGCTLFPPCDVDVVTPSDKFFFFIIFRKFIMINLNELKLVLDIQLKIKQLR